VNDHEEPKERTFTFTGTSAELQRLQELVWELREIETMPLDAIPPRTLFYDAWRNVYVLLNGEQLTPEQVLRTGMFFGMVSKMLKEQKEGRV